LRRREAELGHHGHGDGVRPGQSDDAAPHLVGDGLGPGAAGGEVLLRVLIERGHSTAGAPLIRRAVPGDGQQLRTEAVGLLQVGKMLECPGERVLHRVDRPVGVADEVIRPFAHRIRVLTIRRRERM
jgi:hypothetical protein